MDDVIQFLLGAVLLGMVWADSIEFIRRQDVVMGTEYTGVGLRFALSLWLLARGVGAV